MSGGVRHGAAVQAPAEVAGESPVPPAVTRKNRARREPVEEGRARSALRAAVRGVRLVTGVAIVLGLAFAVAWGSYRYALTSPRFGIEKLDVTGARRVGPARVEALTGVGPGTNLFSVDTDEAERKILGDPWVAEVQVTRRLPSTLEVQLQEQQPVALAAFSGTLFLVARTGEPFKQLAAGDPHELPVITGISADDLARDRAAQLRRLSEGLEILRSYERLPTSKRYPSQELHLDPSGEVVLMVGADGISLHLGRSAWRKRLLMAAKVFSKLGSKATPGAVFLDNEAHPERVVVRMR